MWWEGDAEEKLVSLSLSLSLWERVGGDLGSSELVPLQVREFLLLFFGLFWGGLFLPFRKLCSKVRPREGSQQGPSGPAAEVEATANVWLASLLFGPFPPHLAFESQPSKKKFGTQRSYFFYFSVTFRSLKTSCANTQ